jgi:gluconate 2-dehydrogenase gamma chain
MSTRRDFLTTASLSLGAGWVHTGCATAQDRAQKIVATDGPGPGLTFSAHQWKTLNALLQHLLPGTEADPGAEEINAIGYLDAVMADPTMEPDDVPVISRGTLLVDEASVKSRGKNFVALSQGAQNEVIVARTRLKKCRTLSRTLLRYTLEAYLGDPVHGGNPQGAVWKAVGHRPGHPRPEKKGIGHIPERIP